MFVACHVEDSHQPPATKPVGRNSILILGSADYEQWSFRQAKEIGIFSENSLAELKSLQPASGLEKRQEDRY